MSANTANASARRRRGATTQFNTPTPVTTPTPNQNTVINPLDFIKLLDIRLRRIEENLPTTMSEFSERLEGFEQQMGGIHNNLNNNVNDNVNNTNNNTYNNDLPEISEILNEIAVLQQQIRDVQAFSINTNNQFNRIVQKYNLLQPINPDFNKNNNYSLDETNQHSMENDNNDDENTTSLQQTD